MTGKGSAFLGIGTALLLLSALVTGCRQSADPASPGPASAGPAGEVLVALSDLPEGFDPSLRNTVIGDIGGPIFESYMFHKAPDGELVPRLLEKAEMAPDGSSWTLKLRDGIQFSNGDPATAEDLKFSLDRFRGPETRSAQAAQFRSGISDTTVVDKLTVRVDTPKPWITLPYFLGPANNEAVMVPKKYIEQVGWATFNLKPVGTGPYRLKEVVPGAVTYEAVYPHWRASPRFTRLKVVGVSEEQTRATMLRTGQADLVQSISPETKKQLDREGFVSVVIPASRAPSIRFFGAFGSYRDNPLKKLEVRKALTLAVNKQAILDGIYGGFGEVAQIGLALPGYSLGAPKLPPTPYNPEEAKRLLAQAGYPGGFDLPIIATTIYPEDRIVALAVAGYWEKIGVRVTVRPMDFTVLRPLYAGKEFAPELVGTAAVLANGATPLGVRDLQNSLWSKGILKSTDVADAEIEKAAAASTIDELVRYTEAAYRKTYDDFSMLPIAQVGVIWMANKKVGEIPVSPGRDFVLNSLTRP